MAALFGVHLHDLPAGIGSGLSGEQWMLGQLAKAGGQVARLDFNWSVYQPNEPGLSFNSNAVSLSNTAFATYLNGRGYGSDFAGMRWLFEKLKQSDTAGVSAVLNIGIVPDWARLSADHEHLKKPELVGQFIADFLAYAARQKDGYAILKNVSGWQIFNESNESYGNEPGYLPYDRYFEIAEATLSLVRKAAEKIKWTTNVKFEPPDVIVPSLEGTYDKAFWDAFFQYKPKSAALTDSKGHLAIDAISLQPYGERIDAWRDPYTSGSSRGTDTNSSGAAIEDNLTYHRFVLPTDDRLSFEAMVARDPARSKAWGLHSYASYGGNRSDEYFNRGTEMGTERTMAKLAQAGYSGIEVHFTEWGATTYVGAPDPDAYLWRELYSTTFTDPYKYGYIPMTSKLPVNVAENVQAEAIMQTVGLIESWSFVSSAMAYEAFDRVGEGHEEQFGLAYRERDAQGNPVFKPAGIIYSKFMKGEEWHMKNVSGTAGNIGVDIHIAASGTNGRFDTTKREPGTHELILLRQGDDKISAGWGDDIVFGGSGKDTVYGSKGYDKLYGGSGNDVLSGGLGVDRIKGDSGNDILTGGRGEADYFVFSAYARSGAGYSGHDIITDFEVGRDKLSIIGGYSAKAMLNNTTNSGLVHNVKGGVVIHYADNGASLFLKGVKEADLSVANFRVLETDTTVKPVSLAVSDFFML